MHIKCLVIFTYSFQKAAVLILFGSLGLSTKEPYTIMNFPSCVVIGIDVGINVGIVICAHPPWHRVRYRNFIFGIPMHICPPYMHIKFLVILAWWLIWLINQRALNNHALSVVVIGVILHQHWHQHWHLCTPPLAHG